MRQHVSVLLTVACLVLTANGVAAQDRVVAGTVVDSANRQGIPGADVTVVGGRQSVQAREDGQFRITVPAGPVTLNVRGLGYKQRRVTVGAGTSAIIVAMERQAIELNQVVVTGAATSQERRNVATAVTTVDAQSMTNAPSGSLENALQGKVVGATINMNSGAPGGGAQIQIRGVTTVLGNGDPLYVVDGVIISNVSVSPGTNAISKASGSATALSNQDNAPNRLADIDPDEIESVQVMKSAAASAIYGSMATNGVVLITTKRGHSGAPSFHLSQAVGAESPLKLLGARHFFLGSAATKSGLAGLLGDATAQKYCPGSDPATMCPYYDYESEMYRTRGLDYETNLSMSGGTDLTKYFASAADKQIPGTLMNTGARRQEVRLNIDQSVGDHWSAAGSAGIYRSISDRGLSGNNNAYTNPLQAFAYTPGVVDLQAKDATGKYINNPILPLLHSIGSNPWQLMQEMTSVEDVWRQIVSATVKYFVYSSPLQSLTLQTNGGFDSFSDDGRTYAPPDMQSEQVNALPGRSVQVQTQSQQVNGTVSAVHTWTPGGRLTRLSSATTSIGAQYEERRANTYSVLAQGLIPGLQNVNQGSPTLTQTVTKVRNGSFYASEEVLALDDKLSVSGRVRAEQSSVNGDRNKFYLWPAGAVAYHLPTFIPSADDIKLRFSIGLSGNQPNYGSRDVLIASNGVIGGVNTLGVPSAVGNPSIRPEQMQEDELGIDASFWHSRLGFEGSVFRRDITKLLLQAPLAPTAGFSTQFINGGHMQTRGLELGVSLLPIQTPTLTWTSHVSWYSFQSVMKSMPVPSFNVASDGFGATYGQGRIEAGKATTLIWGNITDKSGAINFVPIADANPKYQVSFSNNFAWHRVTVSTLFDWREGGYLINLSQHNTDEGQTSADYDQPSPDPKVGATLGAWRYNTWNAGTNIYPYVQNGSFVKLREVSLAYDLPARMAAVFRGSAAHVKLSARNLYMWTKYESFDPEVNNWGNQSVSRFFDLFPYPTNRVVTFGFDVTY